MAANRVYKALNLGIRSSTGEPEAEQALKVARKFAKSSNLTMDDVATCSEAPHRSQQAPHAPASSSHQYDFKPQSRQAPQSARASQAPRATPRATPAPRAQSAATYKKASEIKKGSLAFTDANKPENIALAKQHSKNKVVRALSFSKKIYSNATASDIASKQFKTADYHRKTNYDDWIFIRTNKVKFSKEGIYWEELIGADKDIVAKYGVKL